MYIIHLVTREKQAYDILLDTAVFLLAELYMVSTAAKIGHSSLEYWHSNNAYYIMIL